LYYIILFFTIFKIANTENFFFKIMFGWFKELETKLKKI